MADHHLHPVQTRSAHDEYATRASVAIDPQDYVPPQLARLGTLSELTLGGGNGLDDGLGAAGDEGSV